MLTDSQYVPESFENNFSGCKNKKIVLYGKGPFTQLVLDSAVGFHIIGIMDRDITEGTIYGKPVMSYCQAAEADMMIVISRPESMKPIFERISDFCSSNHILLYGIDGENLFDKFKTDRTRDLSCYMFEKNFSLFKNKKIVLYGKGPRTRAIVEAFPEYNIIGLMDREEKEGYYYGKFILSYEEIQQQGVDIIISVTREQTTPHVFNRIKTFCSRNHVLLYDLDGDNLFSKYSGTEEYIEYDSYFEMNGQMLEREILSHDIISFDIFDTLMMRKTLLPSDVFTIVAARAEKEMLNVSGFIEHRKRAERESVVNHANIYDIYNNLQSLTGISEEVKRRLLELEIEVEKGVLFPRTEMVRIFKFALEHDRRVCLTSDMYLTEEILRNILDGVGITGYERLFVSCDYNVSKGSGLFEIVKRQMKGTKYLHIGDNRNADGRCAAGYGIDTFIIKKALDMLDISSYFRIRQLTETYSDRSVVGLLISKIFNDPFALYHSGGKPKVADSYLYGYLFIAPAVAKFMEWFVSEVKKGGYENVLFSARDGYMIHSLYGLYRKIACLEQLPDGIYFPTSRLLNKSASRLTEEDIIYSAEQPRSYSPEHMLKRKFKLEDGEILTFDELHYKDVTEYALAHKEKIFKRSSEIRTYYIKYMEGLGIDFKKRYAIFDFVSSGTSLYDLTRIASFDITGLYVCFYDVGDDKRKQLPIKSMIDDNYPQNNSYTSFKKKSYFFENYVFLESIFSSPETSVEGITKDCELIYGEEHRSQQELRFMENCQAAVRDFFTDYMENLFLDENALSFNLVDEIFRLRELRFTDETCEELDVFSVFEDLGYGKLYFSRK